MLRNFRLQLLFGNPTLNFFRPLRIPTASLSKTIAIQLQQLQLVVDTLAHGVELDSAGKWSWKSSFEKGVLENELLLKVFHWKFCGGTLSRWSEMGFPKNVVSSELQLMVVSSNSPSRVSRVSKAVMKTFRASYKRAVWVYN